MTMVSNNGALHASGEKKAMIAAGDFRRMSEVDLGLFQFALRKHFSEMDCDM
jgi:hypothetical protein